MKSRCFAIGVLGWLFMLPFQGVGELVRVPQTPIFGPGSQAGRPVDLNADGIAEFGFSVQVVSSQDSPPSSLAIGLSLIPLQEVAVLGRSYYSVPVGPGTLIGPDLVGDFAWVSSSFSYHVGGQGQSLRLGITHPWTGALGDPAKPYLGIRFQSAAGTHYGWIRFGFDVSGGNPYFEGAGILEWAYETEPGRSVVIQPPEIPHDHFAAAQELPATLFQTWSDNTLATSEAGEPNPAGLGAGASLWWRWTAPADGYLWLASITGPVATTIGVHTGNTVDQLTQVVASELGCQNGVPALIREHQFAVTAGTTYRLQLDSRASATGVTPKGEVHLQGSFSTVRLTVPGPNASHSARLPLLLAATATEWDGPRQQLSFEADGVTVAVAGPGAMDALWLAPKPGRYQLRAVWVSTTGAVHRSPPVTVNIRPANDDYDYAPNILSLPFAAPASNFNALSEPGEPVTPAGVDANSVWWRWTPRTNGIVTIQVPDGGGLTDVTLYRLDGPWFTNLVAVASTPPNPVAPHFRLNHLQAAVQGFVAYAIAVRSLRHEPGSWLPQQPCAQPVIPGRDFTLRMDFDSTEAGNLLVKQNGPELLASFAARPDRVYVLESSPDFTRWDLVETGVTSGIMQWLSVSIRPEQPAQFFRIRLNPEVDP